MIEEPPRYKVSNEDHETRLRIVALLRGVADWLENQSGTTLRTVLPMLTRVTVDLEAVLTGKAESPRG